MAIWGAKLPFHHLTPVKPGNQPHGVNVCVCVHVHAYVCMLYVTGTFVYTGK